MDSRRGFDAGAQPTTSSEQTVDGRPPAPVVYRLAKTVLHRPLESVFPLEVEGAGQVPAAGPAVIAANHRSFMDSVFLAMVIDRPIRFIAKAEYFERRVGAWLFRSLGQIPLRRGSPAGARRTMNEALEVLADGHLIGVYPEGTRSRDGRMRRGGLGPARLAAASGAPLVPVGLVGTDSVQPPDRTLPRPRQPVRVAIGHPVRVPPSAAHHRRELRGVTDELMLRIAELCDEERERATVGN